MLIEFTKAVFHSCGETFFLLNQAEFAYMKSVTTAAIPGYAFWHTDSSLSRIFSWILLHV